MGSWRPWNAGTGNSWRPARSTAQGLASRYEPAPPTFKESMNGAIPPTERHCCIGGPAAKAWQEEGASVHARRLLHPGGSWPEQAHLGVPEELRRVAGHGRSTVGLPHRPEPRAGLRCLHPPCRGSYWNVWTFYDACITHLLHTVYQCQL